MSGKIFILALLSTSFFFHVNSQTLTSPESISYDKTKNRYLVSDPGIPAILAISSTGIVSTFYDQGLFFPRGTTIVGNILFVTDVGKLLGFDITTDTKVIDTIIPTAAGLNDIVADDKGNLYMSDDVNNQLFKFEIKDTVGYAWIKSGLNAPNGLWFDKANDRLILVSFMDDSPIQAINLTNKTVSTLLSTTNDYLDGIAVDKNGNYYISSWGSNSIYRYNPQFQYEKQFSKNHDGPADILFIAEKDILAVPNMNTGKIEYLSVPTASIPDNSLENDIKIATLNDNNEIIINLSLNKSAQVSVDIYDLNARQVNKLFNQQLETGFHELNFPINILSGMHFVRLSIDNQVFTKKISF